MPRKNLPKRRHKTPRMASKTPDIACREKRRFPTEKQALHGAETQELVHSGITLSVYRCPHCQGWHLTRKTHDA